MKTTILFIYALLLLPSCQSKEADYVLQTDGVYVTDFPMHGMNNLKHYLKFEKDNTVLSLSSPYQLETVQRLLASPSEYVGRGKYLIVNDSLKFITKTQTNSVVYEGIIKPNQKINLKSKSQTNGREFEQEFTYLPY